MKNCTILDACYGGKMKTELTTEQSQHLIELGVPKEKARCELPIGDGEYVFRLTDLLEILESMKDGDFTIKHWKDGEQDIWTCEIDGCVYSYSYSYELIDVLYKQTVRAIELGHLKFD